MTDKLRDENTAAFFAALQANPFDPITRAVFADYLEERGNGRLLVNAEDGGHSIGGVNRRVDVLDCGRVGRPWGGGLILPPK